VLGKICGVTAIDHSFQAPYVHATLEQYDKQDAEHPTPVWAWHGTTMENLERILSHGFALTPVPAHGRAFGHGIYFASLPNFSMSCARGADDGYQHFLLCQVYVRNLKYFTRDKANQFPHAEGKSIGGTIVMWQERVNLTVLPRYIVSMSMR
jgi:hypothetical protein